MMDKIGDTFNFAHNAAKEAAEDLAAKKDEMVQSVVDTTAEAISDAETVVASETESAKEAFSAKAGPIFETVQSVESDLESRVHEVKEDVAQKLHDLEDDMNEHFDMLGDSVETVKEKMEEVLSVASHESPAKESKQEE
nr:unnamed protein product [Callosobruchus chinensis]